MSWGIRSKSSFGVPDLAGSTPTPEDTFNQAVNELPGLIAHWPLGADLNARVGPVNITADSGGGGLTGQPTIVTDDAGNTSRLWNVNTPTIDRLTIPDFAALDDTSFSVIVLTVPKNSAVKGNIITRSSGSLPGSWGVENDSGVARFYLRDDTSFKILTSGAGALAEGYTTGHALCWDASVVDSYYQQVGSSIVKDSLPITLSSVSMAVTASIAAFYGEANPFAGVIAHVIFCSVKLSQTEVETIFDKMQNVTAANDFDAGAITVSTTEDYDVLGRAIYRGTPTLLVTGQPSGDAVASAVSQQVRIEANTDEGADSATFTVDGEAATLSFDVQAAATNQLNAGAYIGSTGWGASAGNGTGVGRYSTSQYWVYRFTAPLSGTMDRFRWNLPKRPAYKGGTGGDMRVTIREDDGSGNPDLAGGGIVWQSSLFVMSQDGSGNMIYPAGVTAFFGFGSDEGAEIVTNAALTAGQVYHVVWTNENSSPSTNWYSINHAWNHSMPQDPYHQWPMWADLATLAGNSSDAFGFAGNRFIPYFQFRRSSDALWWGQNYFDCGTTSNIMTIAGSGSKSGNSREIGGNWQIRQRWTHTAPTMTVSRWRGRVWRRTSNTTYPLRIRLIEEGTGTLADVTVAASSIFQPSLGYDNLSGEVFAPIDVSLGGTFSLTNGSTYQLELSTANDATRFAMRAPNGYSKSTLNIGWGGWLGRGEYSTDGGSSWTGMHMYGTDDRSDCDWSMALHSTAP